MFETPKLTNNKEKFEDAISCLADFNSPLFPEGLVKDVDGLVMGGSSGSEEYQLVNEKSEARMMAEEKVAEVSAFKELSENGP